MVSHLSSAAPHWQNRRASARSGVAEEYSDRTAARQTERLHDCCRKPRHSVSIVCNRGRQVSSPWQPMNAVAHVLTSSETRWFTSWSRQVAYLWQQRWTSRHVRTPAGMERIIETVQFLQRAAMLRAVLAIAFVSVCLFDIVSKRMNVGWRRLHWRLAQCIQFSET